MEPEEYDIWGDEPDEDEPIYGYEEEFEEEFGYKSGEEFGDDEDIFQDEPEYQVSYKQLEQLGGEDPELGMFLGGKYTRLEKAVQAQTVSKEKLYLQKLKAELNRYFSFPQSNHYAILIQQVPRFWLKNREAMAGVIYMIEELNKTNRIINARVLDDFSAKTGIRQEDLFRYYRQINKYIK